MWYNHIVTRKLTPTRGGTRLQSRDARQRSGGSELKGVDHLN